MFEQIFGPELGLPARAIVALVLVLALIALTVWLMRRFGDSRIATQAGGRGRQQRLAVLDSTTVDARRKLVLIRRDNVEHLILIGGPTDVVIEQSIIRAQPAAGGVRPAARPVGYEDEETSLIPDTLAAEFERPASSAPAAPTARAPQPERPEPSRPSPRPAHRLDPQYADMAQRLEAALGKPTPEPEVTRAAPERRPVPPAPEQRAPEPRMEPKPTAPAPAPRAPMPRIPESRPEPRVEAPRPQAAPQVTPPPQQAAPQPAQPASADQAAADVFSSLEEEMASLLRPGGRKDPQK